MSNGKCRTSSVDRIGVKSQVSEAVKHELRCDQFSDYGNFQIFKSSNGLGIDFLIEIRILPKHDLALELHGRSKVSGVD